MTDHIRIVLYQQALMGRLPPEDFEFIQKLRPDFVCLPEYFFIPPDSLGHQAEAEQAAKHKEKLAEWSGLLETVLIGGSIVEAVNGRYFNTCYVYDKGRMVGSYSKVNLFGGETESGLSAGTTYSAFSVGRVKIGVLICADVLNPISFLEMKRLECDIVFVPTTSPFKLETVTDKYERDAAIFEEGAMRSEAVIAKCCAIGTIFGNRLQGRSLVASPAGILQRVRPDQEDQPVVLVEDLSLSLIRNWKESLHQG